MRRYFGLLMLLCGCGGAPPSGETGAVADELAQRMRTAVRADAWAATGAVRSRFADKNHHLWDRSRSYARVQWDDHRVLLDLTTRTGRVWTEGAELHGEDSDDRVDEAHAKWVNDAFWLNPVVKVNDAGVTRARVVRDGVEGLRVTYSSSARTPGDSYLWWVGPDGWIELATGARVSTVHETAVFTLRLTEVAGAATLAQLVPGADPFAELVRR
jgi:hypothetical protein